MVDSDVLLARQRGPDVIADEGFADNLAIGMRVANTVHIGDDGKQQAVASGDGLRQRLDNTALRRQRQATLDFRGVGQRPRHRQRRIFHAVTGGAANLHKPQGIDQNQY